VILGAWGLRKYYNDSTKLLSIVFRDVTGIFLVFIFLDVYFAYLILQ